MAEAKTDDAAKLWKLIREVKVAMMTTEDGDVLRSRPMVAVDRDFDGTLWFFTRAGSHKVSEVASDERVNLSYADPSGQNYASVSGTATLVREKAEVEAHWQESMRVWFPKGKQDPDIALLRVSVSQGEYWDAPSSTMLHAYGYVKAVLTGKPPVPGGHGKVDHDDVASGSTDR